MGYTGGEYQLAKLDPTLKYYPWVPIPGTFLDTTIAVDARSVGRVPSSSVGIECRHRVGDGSTPTDHTGYRVEVSPAAGTVTLQRWDQGKGPTVLVNQKVASIRPAEQGNHVDFTCNGSTIEARVNGGPPVSTVDGTYQAGQFIFLAIGDPGQLPDIRFSHLLITKPAAGAGR
jgi:hypothetical protein